MTMTDLPLWATVPAGVLLVIGGLLALIGSLGLLRLPTFMQRMHGPSMGSTLGTGCVLVASMLVSSGLLGRPVLHQILITIFIVMSAPVSAMLLMRAAVYRADVPLEEDDGATSSTSSRRAQSGGVESSE